MDPRAEAAARPHVDSGRLRVLATTAPERSVVFPQAPSFAVGGLPTLDQREWFGVFAAGGSPQARTRAISERLRVALRSPDVHRTWEKIGLTVVHADPEGLREAMRRENAFWGPLVRDSGFVPEN
jgi:tripartite-type tricarboxylate transporter receptor subunit TctC